MLMAINLKCVTCGVIIFRVILKRHELSYLTFEFPQASYSFHILISYILTASAQGLMAKHEPMFISRSETFKFIAGDIIVLPCEVANTGE